LPKAVVDTNLFVSGLISARGRPGRLLDVWRAGWFELLLSDQQYTELRNGAGTLRIVTAGQFLAALDESTNHA
jgi:predicted nucleic acid-binding protein